ncbi:hypothetical protein, partial [Litorilituus lipolyticus]|uniref:hypothetical protein n=1 Tax=Litorilituus lipolyticus TaxID=2491017 RepID=UPI001BA5900B
MNIISGSAGACSSDDGFTCIFNDVTPIGVDTLQTLLLTKDVQIYASDDLIFSADMTWSDRDLLLVANNDLLIESTLTATNTSTLRLIANFDTANDIDPFAQSSPNDNRIALDSIGRLRFPLADNNISFKGKIEFGSRSGTGILSIDHDGDGTLDNYNLVSSLAELDAINDATLDDANQRVALSTNLDLSGTTFNGSVLFSSSSSIFTGHFEGLGHVVDGFINSGNGSDSFIGRSGNNAHVRNIGFTNVDFTSSSYNAGVITSSTTGITLHNAFAVGNFTGTTGSSSYYGGLIGTAYTTTGTVLIEQAFADVNIVTPANDSDAGVGGLIGWADVNSFKIIIRDAGALGDIDVTGTGDEIGGLIGYTFSYTTDGFIILDAFAKGNINALAPNATTDKIGGLIGEVRGQITIDRSYASGDVYGNDNVGGFIGGFYDQYIASVKGEITKSYSSGDVFGFDNTSTDDVGGFIGEIDNASFTIISTAFAYGEVTTLTDYSGALFGSVDSDPTLTNVYWNSSTNSSNVGTNSPAVSGSSGLTNASFINQSDFTGFDFVNDWVITPAIFPHPILRTLSYFSAPVITSSAGTAATEDLPYSYTPTVEDADDSNNGMDLTWSLTNAPTGMTVSSVGVVQWTPTEGILSSGAVTLTVSDGALSDNEIFTISVTPVNDAPSITSTAGTTAIEDVQYSYAASVSDSDDSNNGVDLTWSLTNAPTGMTVSS